MAFTCNPNTHEGEAGDSEVRSHLQLLLSPRPGLCSQIVLNIKQGLELELSGRALVWHLEDSGFDPQRRGWEGVETVIFFT